MNIGTFMKDKNGQFHGRVYGLNIGVISVLFEPQTSKNGKGYYRLVADPAKEAFEVGRAWPKQLGDGTVYHSVNLDSPFFSDSINAALFADRNNDEKFNLVWTRLDPIAVKPENTANTNPKPQARRKSNEPMANL